jgi:hypothetical protein
LSVSVFSSSSSSSSSSSAVCSLQSDNRPVKRTTYVPDVYVRVRRMPYIYTCTPYMRILFVYIYMYMYMYIGKGGKKRPTKFINYVLTDPH